MIKKKVTYSYIENEHPSVYSTTEVKTIRYSISDEEDVVFLWINNTIKIEFYLGEDDFEDDVLLAKKIIKKLHNTIMKQKIYKLKILEI